jgi:hypothetical protein
MAEGQTSECPSSGDAYTSFWKTGASLVNGTAGLS